MGKSVSNRKEKSGCLTFFLIVFLLLATGCVFRLLIDWLTSPAVH